MKLKDVLKEKRAEILAIAAKHGAKDVRIFGSVARGEDNAESDIDFLVDYDLEKITPWFPGGLLMDLESLLGRKVDIVTERGLHDYIRERIMQEAILL
jgi:predicted nucleotidyltransferase